MAQDVTEMTKPHPPPSEHLRKTHTKQRTAGGLAHLLFCFPELHFSLEQKPKTDDLVHRSTTQ